jgi:transcriptional regulator with XRE-family HTH domain
MVNTHGNPRRALINGRSIALRSNAQAKCGRTAYHPRMREPIPPEPAADQAPVASGAGDDFAARLRAAREERGFRQSAVAGRTKMIDPEGRGVSRTAIIAYEQGTTNPGVRELKLICEVLHVTPNWLIYGSDSAGTAALPSMELLSRTPGRLDDVITTALALTALKGHERDAVQTLVLSLAGRQLGDMRLSVLLTASWGMRDAFRAVLKSYLPDLAEDATLNDIADRLAERGTSVNAGNRFRLGDEGEILNPEQAVYPDPEQKS